MLSPDILPKKYNIIVLLKIIKIEELKPSLTDVSVVFVSVRKASSTLVPLRALVSIYNNPRS